MTGKQGRHPISLEDALGPAAGRFFGAGYRGVTHTLEGGLLQPDAFKGTGKVEYPRDWSTRADGSPRTPHLSTIDAVLLPLQAIEQAWPGRPGDYVRGIHLRAGNRPWLELADVPVAAHISQSTSQGGDLRNFSAITGNIKAQIYLANAASEIELMEESNPFEVSDVYRDLYRSTEGTTMLTQIDSETGALTAFHEFSSRSERPGVRPDGLESCYWPALSVVDYLVTMGQIVQVLIEERLGGDRTNGQLWMRTMSIHLTSPPEQLPAAITTRTIPIDERVIDRGGQRLRLIATDSKSSNGVQVKAQLAHVEEP